MPKLSQSWVVKTQIFNVTMAENNFTKFHIFVSDVYNFWPIVIKLGQIWDFCIAIRTTPKFLKSEEICPSYGLITEENFLDHFSCAFHPFFWGIFFSGQFQCLMIELQHHAIYENFCFWSEFFKNAIIFLMGQKLHPGDHFKGVRPKIMPKMANFVMPWSW